MNRREIQVTMKHTVTSLRKSVKVGEANWKIDKFREKTKYLTCIDIEI
jgi:hypothetical protein